jgi:hypothetical protein
MQLINIVTVNSNKKEHHMTNLALINAKRVAAKLEAAGLIVNRMGKRNDNKYSIQVTRAEGTLGLAAHVEELLKKEHAKIKTTKAGFVRVFVAPTRDEKGHFIKKVAKTEEVKTA